VDINVATSSKRSKSLPTSGVIDLEAENGVGKGVSGKPLLPGELEARQQRVRHMWTLRASRSTEDTPEEQHYRFAESAWCRGGGQAAEIGAIEYHFHPALEARWHAKKAEYDARFGADGHTILYVFHGTTGHNVDAILRDGFLLSKLGASNDMGVFGAGLYFSEQMGVAECYNAGNDGLLLCKVLLGKPFVFNHDNVPLRQGRALEPGYTSHVSNPTGSQVVIFDEAAALPIYVIKKRAETRGVPTPTEPFKGLGVGGGGGSGVGARKRRSAAAFGDSATVVD